VSGPLRNTDPRARIVDGAKRDVTNAGRLVLKFLSGPEEMLAEMLPDGDYSKAITRTPEEHAAAVAQLEGCETCGGDRVIYRRDGVEQPCPACAARRELVRR
jgi:hypothetical protein